MNLALVLSLASAGTIGTADYLGGIAARRVRAIPFTAAAQTVNLLILFIAASAQSATVTPRDLAFGAAAGVSGSLAFGVFLIAMAAGPMSVVSPITALLGAGSGFAIGIALGDSPSQQALLGCLTGLFAIALVSHAGKNKERIRARTLALAIGSGIGFGGFVVFLDRPDAAAGLWPLVAARTAGVTALLLVSAVRREGFRTPRSAAGLVLAVGLLESVAIISLQAALHEGSLAIVAVVSSLYPVSTLILARVRLHERLVRHQVIGVGLALGAVVLIASG